MSATRSSLLDDLDHCPCAGRTLDRLIQPAVLTVLARKQLHGYRIVQQIAKMPTLRARAPDAAGVYRSLKSMEKRRLVVSSWDLSDSGPARRLYELTDAGRECLGNWVRTLEGYRKAIGGLLTSARNAQRSRKPRRREPRRKVKSAAVRRRGGRSDER